MGMIADDPDNKIELKVFHNEILNDHEEIKRETTAYKPLPVIRNVSHEEVQANYNQIKENIQILISTEIGKLQAAIKQQPEDEGNNSRALSL